MVSRLTLKTEKETLHVILGPSWYIEQQHFAVAPKDQVEIKGSRIPIQGQSTPHRFRSEKRRSDVKASGR